MSQPSPESMPAPLAGQAALDPARRSARGVPPPAMVLIAIISVQSGAAIAKGLFASLGPAGTAFVRIGLAAVMLLVLWRPSLRGLTRYDTSLVVLFGISIVGLNNFYYAAIARIPLGIAISAALLGPLGIAIASSRNRRDIAWAVLAIGGIGLLTPVGSLAIDPLGLGLALLDAVCWASFIMLNVRVARRFPGGTGLALGMMVAALIMLPVGITSGGSALLQPMILLKGLAVAILSSFIPFSLEFEALRRLPPRVFGVLLSLEPAMGTLVGFVVLGEAIQMRALAAVAFITIASAGSALSRSARGPWRTWLGVGQIVSLERRR